MTCSKRNFERLFKSIKIGEMFDFKVNCTYTFDEEEKRDIVYTFKVKCEKGEYISPFLVF